MRIGRNAGGTLVTVGNAHQPFHRLLNEVKGNLESLPAPVVVQYGHTPFDCPGAIGVQFLEFEEFRDCLEGARLLISHGGAGALLQAIYANKRPVVMPRDPRKGEHVDAHQWEMVAFLERLGLVEVAGSDGGIMTAVDRALSSRPSPAVESRGQRLVSEIERVVLRCAERAPRCKGGRSN